MSAAVHVVTVGVAAAAGGDPEGSAVVAALTGAGVSVAARVFVEEDERAVEQAFAADGGLTVILAGAGGSAGDVVRRVIARAAGVRLVLHDRMLAAIEASYRRRERAMPRRSERLALLPQGAVLWPSAAGEPGWMVDVRRGVFVVLPRGSAGLATLVDDHLLPLARARVDARGVVVTRTLKTVGVSLADVEERLAPWLGRERRDARPAEGRGARPAEGDVSVVVLPAETEIWIRLRVRGAAAGDAEEALRTTETEVTSALGDDCYGRDGETLEQVVARVLTARGLTLAVAESCTGGLIGHRLSNLPDSSSWLERGVVAYSTRAKVELLALPESVVRMHGDVSAPAAEAMARGVCAIASTPCGLSTTGIAGPGGGTRAHPVGTVFIGLAVPGEVVSRRFVFTGDHVSIKWQASSMALDMLRRRLGGFA